MVEIKTSGMDGNGSQNAGFLGCYCCPKRTQKQWCVMRMEGRMKLTKIEKRKEEDLDWRKDRNTGKGKDGNRLFFLAFYFDLPLTEKSTELTPKMMLCLEYEATSRSARRSNRRHC